MFSSSVHFRFRLAVVKGSAVLVLLLLAFVANTFAQTATSPVPLPVPFTPIVDNANVIDANTRQRLETIFKNLRDRADIEFAVLTVPTTGDQDIFDFSLAVARGWGIGPKGGDKAGFLLVVAINDRKYFTQVSDHLEADLTDGVVGQIQRERLVPQFRRQNYSQGIYDTIQAYVATLAAKRGFNVDGIDQSYAYREETPRPASGGNSGLSSACCTIIIIFFVVMFLISAANRGGRGGRGGGGGGWLGWLLLSQLLSSSGGRSSGGWGGSSSGWGGGGFGGGGGGFGGGFGGGGSFGGGGAGGSW